MDCAAALAVVSGTCSAAKGVSHAADDVYDLRGLNCPLPVLRTRKRLSGMRPGDRLVIETTDPLAVIDIPAFCRDDGHLLISCEARDNAHRFTIERAGTALSARQS